MGNENSAYSNCRFEDEIKLAGQEHWLVNQASAPDGSPVSVFVYQRDSKEYDAFVENCVKSLKTLKHPSILKFLAYIKNSDEKWVITERVLPLETVIDKLSPTEICAGLYSVVEALAFLNDRGNICHNNICQSSIFVASDGSWKVGGLEYMCRFQEANASSLSKSKNLRFKGAIAPEEQAGKLDTSLQYAHSRDAYAFGILAEYLMEYLAPLGDKCSNFEYRIKNEFLNQDPKLRPKFNTLLDDPIFRDDYVSILNFLKNITIKTEVEKTLFFSTVSEKLYRLPEETVATRLIRPFLSRFVLIDQNACDMVIPHLLTPCKVRKPTFEPDEINPMLTENLFRRYALPEIFRIFHVKDAFIRLILLRHFADYCHLFSKATLASIFPQLLLGLRDSNDSLVAMTLHAVAELVPLLGGDIVIGAKRNKIFTEGRPRFSGQTGETSTRTTKQNGQVLQFSSSRAVSDKKSLTDDAERQQMREKKKEEARRRNEERKKRREEKLRNQNLGMNAVDRGETDATAREEDGYPAEEIPAEERSKSPEQAELSEEEEEFSDVELPAEELHDATPSDIPEAIRTPPPPVHLDWSDVDQVTARQQGSSEKTKGVLKLQKDKPKENVQSNKKKPSSPKKKAPPVKSSKVDDMWGQDDWQDFGDEEVGDETPSSDTVVRSQGPPKIQEVDLFAMDIKTSATAAVKEVEEEVDFFADMQPDFKPQGKSSLLSILNGDVPKMKPSPEKKKKDTLSFAVQDTDAVDEGAWGDDADWGVEEDLDIS